jgi:hypothetical protein
MVPVIVGLALALLAFLVFLDAFVAGASTDWKRASIVLSVALGTAFAIGWAAAHLAARVLADRRRIAILGVLLFAAMGLCPPWVYTFSPPGRATTTKPAGYHLLFNPPSEDPYFTAFASTF